MDSCYTCGKHFFYIYPAIRVGNIFSISILLYVRETFFLYLSCYTWGKHFFLYLYMCTLPALPPFHSPKIQFICSLCVLFRAWIISYYSTHRNQWSVFSVLFIDWRSCSYIYLLTHNEICFMFSISQQNSNIFERARPSHSYTTWWFFWFFSKTVIISINNIVLL